MNSRSTTLARSFSNVLQSYMKFIAMLIVYHKYLLLLRLFGDLVTADIGHVQIFDPILRAYTGQVIAITNLLTD